MTTKHAIVRRNRKMQRVALCSSLLLTVVIPTKTETQPSSYQQFLFIRLITPCPHSIVYCLFTRVTGACHCSKQQSPRTYMSLAISYSNRVVSVALSSYTTQPRWISGYVLSKQIWFHRQKPPDHTPNWGSLFEKIPDNMICSLFLTCVHIKV